MNKLTRYLLKPFRREDMAHSPFHQAIKNVEERRSQLFPDRRRIPGRKAKVLLGIGFCLQLYGMSHLMEVRRFMKRRDKDMAKLQRKVLDRFRELFRYKGDDFLKSIESRFNQRDVWVPWQPRYEYMYNKTSRQVKPYYTAYQQRYLNCYDRYNI